MYYLEKRRCQEKDQGCWNSTCEEENNTIPRTTVCNEEYLKKKKWCFPRCMEEIQKKFKGVQDVPGRNRKYEGDNNGIPRNTGWNGEYLKTNDKYQEKIKGIP